MSHDEMHAAMGMSPRPTSAPAGGGPQLTPPCAKVYLPSPLLTAGASLLTASLSAPGVILCTPGLG